MTISKTRERRQALKLIAAFITSIPILTSDFGVIMAAISNGGQNTQNSVLGEWLKKNSPKLYGEIRREISRRINPLHAKAPNKIHVVNRWVFNQQELEMAINNFAESS